MTDNVEKKVALDMVDDLIPGAREKREDMQARLARAERSVGYSQQGRFDDRYWERGDSLDDLGGTSSYKKPYKAPYVAPVATKLSPTTRIKNLMNTGTTFTPESAAVKSIVLNKVVNELVGMVEEVLDGADFTWKTGGSKLFRETFKLAMLETMEIYNHRISKDVPLKEVADETDDEDQFDDWYKKVNAICFEKYGFVPVDDFAWSMDGLRSVWFNGSNVAWMVKHFAEREGLKEKPCRIDQETGEVLDEPSKKETAVQSVALDD